MKKSLSILSILSIVLINNIFAQADTQYVNETGVIVDKGHAVYYRVVSKADSNLYEFREYFLNNKLKKIFHSISPHATVLEGDYCEFDHTGSVVTQGSYSKGYKTGEWNYFFPGSKRKEQKQVYSSEHEYYKYQYDSLNQKVESEGAIDKYGKRTGVWKQYHFNSDNVKMLSNYIIGKKEGEQLEYYKDGKIKRREIFLNNKLQKGELYDETGKRIKYFPAFVYPQYREYVSNYLHRSEPCAADALKKMDFQVSMVISKEGEVLDAFVKNVENDECAKKIKSALMKMKKWKPALWENNPVKYTFETAIKLYVPRE